MFSNGSSSSISLATETPSCVTVGEPNLRSTATLRPLGPRVVPTALTTTSMPFLSLRRASSVNTSCFAAIVHSSVRLLAINNAEQVGLAQDQQFLAVQLQL